MLHAIFITVDYNKAIEEVITPYPIPIEFKLSQNTDDGSIFHHTIEVW